MRRVSFISGTRADYGKIKPYVDYFLSRRMAEVYIFVTGMHFHPDYGQTYREIEKDFQGRCRLIYDKAFPAHETTVGEMAHVMKAYETHLKQDEIDFAFVHGDRSEAFAAAVAAAFQNVGICHLEAGDLSGSIDESLRHAISKFSHRFFVADEQARTVLIQLGEDPKSIFITGNSSLAQEQCSGNNVLRQRGVSGEYAVLIYHPVTTSSAEKIRSEIAGVMERLQKTGQPCAVVLPNNDLHSDVIREVYQGYETHPNFHFFKSLPFDDFRTLLKEASFLVGNSSCGIKEAPYYGVPSIDIGGRQQNRYQHLHLPLFFHIDTPDEMPRVMKEMKRLSWERVDERPWREEFFQKLDEILTPDFWTPPLQKKMHLIQMP